MSGMAAVFTQMSNVWTIRPSPCRAPVPEGDPEVWWRRRNRTWGYLILVLDRKELVDSQRTWTRPVCYLLDGWHDCGRIACSPQFEA
jgi:hypothetical protein